MHFSNCMHFPIFHYLRCRCTLALSGTCGCSQRTRQGPIKRTTKRKRKEPSSRAGITYITQSCLGSGVFFIFRDACWKSTASIIDTYWHHRVSNMTCWLVLSMLFWVFVFNCLQNAQTCLGGLSSSCPSEPLYVSFFGSQAAPAVEEPKAAPETSAPETSEAKAEAVAEVKESVEAGYVTWQSCTWQHFLMGSC